MRVVECKVKPTLEALVEGGGLSDIVLREGIRSAKSTFKLLKKVSVDHGAGIASIEIYSSTTGKFYHITGYVTAEDWTYVTIVDYVDKNELLCAVVCIVAIKMSDKLEEKYLSELLFNAVKAVMEITKP